MVRAPYFDANGIKKGAWSEEEDKKLTAYVERYGHPNWRQLPRLAGLLRCGKSCRLRWMNYLRPNLKRGNYSQKEEQLIMDLHKEHGNKWSLIAENLPGRTDNEIKNYWHSHLKKFQNCNVNNTSSDDDDDDDLNKSKSKSSSQNTKEHERPKSEVLTFTTDDDNDDDSHHILESSLSNVTTESSYSHTEEEEEDNKGSNNNNNAWLCFSSGHEEESNREEDRFASWGATTLFDEFGSSFWTEPFISDDAFSQDYNYILYDREDPFFI